MKLLKFITKHWFITSIASGILLFVIVYSCNLMIEVNSRDKIFSDSKDISAKKVALVLGANKHASSGINLYFKYRMEAAIELYKQGKITHLILSGDNHSKKYDEPTDMMDYLISQGIPESAITLDYAGFRTLDSVVRCKKIFGQDDFIIISQEFHLERALFLCENKNISAIGYKAKEVNKRYSTKTMIREYFARVKAVLDIYILRTSPKFLGKQEFIQL